MINHVLAALRAKIRIQPHTATASHMDWTICKHSTAQAHTWTESSTDIQPFVTVLSPTIFLSANAGTQLWGTFADLWSHVALNKSRAKASSFCCKIEVAGRRQEEAPEPKVITGAWRCLITFYQNRKKNSVQGRIDIACEVLKGKERK